MTVYEQIECPIDSRQPLLPQLSRIGFMLLEQEQFRRLRLCKVVLIFEKQIRDQTDEKKGGENR